jgi:glycine/D-amino acid oxidase-like deaminating enzyme
MAGRHLMIWRNTMKGRTSPTPHGSRWHERAIAGLRTTPFWLDTPAAPPPAEPLVGLEECDLAVVGGGYTGLWTALQAKERDPGLDVVVLEAGRVGWQASGRNGGFCMATLTHGWGNGAARFPRERRRLETLGMENLTGIEDACAHYEIDCAWERTGELHLAVASWQERELIEERDERERARRAFEYFDREAVQAEVRSPMVVAGLWEVDSCAMVDPARLAWGVARACRRLGVRFYEGTPVTGLARSSAGVRLTTAVGGVHARVAALATNAFRPLVRRARALVVPVYDYALVTEPLTIDQRVALGWERRQGLADAGNRFHYFRLTADDRILWGGFDAVYHYGSAVRPEFETRPATFAKLSRHFFALFPQLEGVRFSHGWGGVIDTSTRFCPCFGTALGGRAAYALGFTGSGVGSSRFAGRVMLDLLSRERTELTELEFVRSAPAPWPPEPLRWGGVELTQRSMAWADAHGGVRNGWLRTLDRLGLGFDS